jgi:serine/threonine protein kinase
LATSFHGFLVKGKIGAGGMSTVYKGSHETLGYPVAIKVLHPGMAGDKSFIARFEREAKAASSLRNNNIASVIDFGSEDDIYFIVMEFIDGKDLGQVLADLQNSSSGLKVFPIEIVFSILEEVAYGLKDAHEQGIIHRDIKPSNILLHKRGDVKIADFGLARNTSDVTSLVDIDLTVPGTVVGTPSFMSPEQAAGRELDSRTDIFSLGVMAYQLLMGEKPFQGKTAVEVQEAIITQEPPPLTRERCPLLIPEVVTLVSKMLAKDPNRRFQTMEQVLRSLSDCMEKVDSSGSLIKFKRDYLTKFSQDPVGFSQELRKKGINNHLKQGLHYQKMGLSNIDDAIREFNYVLSLEPDNEKAQLAIAELIKNAEESGIVPAYQGAMPFDSGETQVLTTSSLGQEKPAAPARSKPAVKKPKSPPLGGRNPLVMYGGAAALVLVIILAVVFWPRGDGSTPEREPDVAVVTPQPDLETPPLSGENSNPEETSVDTTAVDLNVEAPPVTVAEKEAGPSGSEVAVEKEPEPEPVVSVGKLKITSEPSRATVYIKSGDDRDFRRVGSTPHVTEDLAVGRWEIRLEKDGFLGQSKVFGVTENTQRALDFNLAPVHVPSSEPGFFQVVIVPYGDVYLDGELFVKDKKLVRVPASPREGHELRIVHGATVGDFVMSDLKVASGDTLDLGRKIFSVGGLKVGANTQAQVLLDGVEIQGSLPLSEERVLVGDHVLFIRKPGLVVDKAWVYGDSGKMELPALNPGSANSGYRITIKKNETLRIKFDMKTAN